MKQHLHHFMAMRNHLFLMFVLLAAVVPTMAQEGDFYAVYNPETATLTFKKCTERHDDGNNYYSIKDYLVNPKDQGTRKWSECKNLTTKVVIDESFKQCELTSCESFFDSFTYLTSIKGLENLNTSKVQAMYKMFFSCECLDNLDLTGLNTSNVEDMGSMFAHCKNLTNLNLKDFCTSKVTNMREMFSYCSILTTLDLKSFDTSNVTNMSAIFSSCTNLTDLDLKGFDTSKVENMSYMFNSCKKLNALDLKGFDTSNVTDMSSMFFKCEKLASLDLKGFDTSNVEKMSSMFYSCSSLSSLDLTSFKTSKVTNMNYMFQNCSGLGSLDLTSFNTSKVTGMRNMFTACKGLTSINLTNFDTSNVEIMTYIFYDCTNLTTLDLTSFNTSKVTEMSYMFGSSGSSEPCNLSNIYVSDQFNVPSNSNNAITMFRGCSALPNYNSNKIGASMANYKTGYFKTYCKVGDTRYDLHGEDMTVANLTLTDGKDFMTYAPFKAQAATYSRTLPNRWATLCLPYAVQVADVEECDIYAVVESLADGVLTVERMESGSVAAGQPVLLRRKGDAMVTVTFSAADADVVKAPTANTENAYNLMGSFVATQVPQDCYTIANNKFWLVSSVNTDQKKVWIKGFRAYIQPKAQPAAAPTSLTIGEGSTTAIEGVEGDSASLLEAATNGQAEIYNAAGVRLDSLQKGLNIIRMGKRSQKVIIK